VSRSFEITSTLADANPREVWDHAVSWAGVNAELAPIAMSHPAEFPSVDSVPADGEVHFVSTLSVLGVPFDRHRLTLHALEPGRYFHEVSSNLLMRRWTHRRVVEPGAGGARVTDQCSFEGRTGVPEAVLLAVYRRVFARRHTRLRAMFASRR